MSVTWGSKPLLDILRLEAERRALWDTAARRRLRADEIGRLKDLGAILNRRWEDRRSEKAGAKAGHMVEAIVNEGEWRQDQGRGRALQVANI